MPDEPEPTEEELEIRLRKLLGDAEEANAEELDEIELKLRDVEDELTKQQDGRKEDDAFFDAEFDDRLRKLHDRVEKAKTARQADESAREREMAAQRESARGLGLGLTVAYTIVGLPLAGVAIGWFVDRSLGTTMGKAIGVLAGAALGMGMALIMLSKANQQK